MSKSHTKKSPRQDLVVVNQATVQIPLPLLSALEDAESAFFGLCVEAGKQVLAAMMENDRIALCGPAGRFLHRVLRSGRNGKDQPSGAQQSAGAAVLSRPFRRHRRGIRGRAAGP